jgi:hypothetical protein
MLESRNDKKGLTDSSCRSQLKAGEEQEILQRADIKSYTTMQSGVIMTDKWAYDLEQL